MDEETGSDRLGDLRHNRIKSSSDPLCLSPELGLRRPCRISGEREATHDLPDWEGGGVPSWPQIVHSKVKSTGTATDLGQVLSNYHLSEE